MRTNLARAFVHGAPILILDEPTSSVEAGQGGKIMRNVLRGSKNTVLATTHEPSYLPWFDRIILLENGRKVCDGPYEKSQRHGNIRSGQAAAIHSRFYKSIKIG